MRTAPRTKALLVAVFLASAVLVFLSWRSGSEHTAPAPELPSIHAVGLRQTTVYHSPQKPGYSAWVGAWTMPDGSLMTAFVRATGPIDPARRESAPARVVKRFGLPRLDPKRDFWGLHLAVEYLRSRNGGRSWHPFRSDPFKAIGPYGFTPQATIGLKDGSLLRRVNGDDLRQNPAIPHTAFLQRLEPGARNWSAPQVLMDPRKYTYQVSRVRYLRDGRLIATGNYWKTPADTPLAVRAKLPSTFLLMVSSDGGRTWRNGLTIPADVGYLPGYEWDTAELPDGDLVAVMRTLDSPSTRKQVRKQALLEKHGAGWVMRDVGAAPFPHSGHPELLATREGPVLHIADTGVHYTKDGRTWTPLRFSPRFAYKSNYYPRAVQTADGVVHVFGHVGADDDYGERDQSITMDTFRLVTERGATKRSSPPR
jgi:hypothetical protein